MSRRWEVLTAIGAGWENVWTESDGETTAPLTFPSYEDAQCALDEFLEDAAAAGMDYSKDDYCIEEVQP